MKGMTAEEQAEWDYRWHERLGILCGANMPTDEENRIAMEEADETIRQLRATNWGKASEGTPPLTPPVTEK